MFFNKIKTFQKTFSLTIPTELVKYLHLKANIFRRYLTAFRETSFKKLLNHIKLIFSNYGT